MREGDMAAGLFCAAIGGPFILLLWGLERFCLRLLRRARGKPGDEPESDGRRPAVTMRERLMTAATKVRRALDPPGRVFACFPKGMCQGSSKLLAKYLVEVEGIVPLEAVANGTRHLATLDELGQPVEQRHFWLECSGLIIDITADQYEDCSEPVIVTADRSWHDQFKGQRRLSQEVALDLNEFLLERYTRMLRVIDSFRD